MSLLGFLIFYEGRIEGGRMDRFWKVEEMKRGGTRGSNPDLSTQKLRRERPTYVKITNKSGCMLEPGSLESIMVGAKILPLFEGENHH